MHSSTLRLAGRKMCKALATSITPALMTFQACATWAQSPVATTSAVIRDVPASLKSIGTAVTQRYDDFHILINTVVPIQSASVASNWFAMPNMGQIEDILPV